MPQLICPTCGLQTYSAARHAQSDCCPRCDTTLKDAERRLGSLGPLDLQLISAVARHEEAGHGPR